MCFICLYCMKSLKLLPYRYAIKWIHFEMTSFFLFVFLSTGQSIAIIPQTHPNIARHNFLGPRSGCHTIINVRLRLGLNELVMVVRVQVRLPTMHRSQCNINKLCKPASELPTEIQAKQFLVLHIYLNKNK